MSLPDEDSERRLGKKPLVATFACGVFAFLNLYCTQPLLPFLATVFHVTEPAVGVTVSAATFGVAGSAAVLALFAERLDRKRTIVGAMTALALTTLLTSTATSLPILAAWRFVQGVLTPGIFIMTIAYTTEEWPLRLVPRMMSVYVAGTVFGGFLGRVIGGTLAERIGWRPVFLVLGALGLGGAALTQALLRPAARRASAPPESPFAPIARNARNPRLLATFGIGFCMLFTLVSVFSYVTFYLVAPPFRLSTEALSWLFAVYLFGLVATLAAGTILDRVGLRGGMLAAIGLSLVGVTLTLVPTLPTVGLGLALTGSGVFVAQTCANSFLRDAAPAGARVSAAGMYIACYYVGGTVGGVLPGFVWRAFGWPGCVATTSSVLLVALACTYFGWRLPSDAPATRVEAIRS